MKRNARVRVICPYYREDRKGQIFCDGLYRRGSISLNFASAADKEAHHALYCDTWNYFDCPIAAWHEKEEAKE